MVCRKLNLAQALARFCDVPVAHADNLQHAQNAVDGRAEVMAHAVHELGFRLVFRINIVQRLLQALLFLLVVLVECRRVPEQDDATHHQLLAACIAVKCRIARHQHNLLQPHHAVARALLIFDGHFVCAAFEAPQQLFRCVNKPVALQRVVGYKFAASLAISIVRARRLHA